MRKLTDAQLEELRDARGLPRPGTHTQLLASLGLVVSGRSRFGEYVRLTEEGKQHLEACVPVAAPGPAEAGNLLRGAGTRQRRNPATNARSRADIPPPSAAQNVGAPSSKKKRGR